MVENINNYLVVDVSVVLAVLLPDERILEKSRKHMDILLDRDRRIYVPVLLDFELGNGLRSAVLRKRISIDESLDLWKSYKEFSFVLLRVNWLNVLRLAIENKLSFYDASYLYLALEKKAKFLTLDKRLEGIWRRLRKI